MQFDDPQQHVVTFECAPSDTNTVVHLLSVDGCCGNCGAFCYRPQEIAGSVCPRVCVTLDSPQLCSLYLCVCAPRICVFVLPVFLAQVHNVAFCVSSCVHFVTLPRLLFNCLHFCICTFRLLYLAQCMYYVLLVSYFSCLYHHVAFNLISIPGFQNHNPAIKLVYYIGMVSLPWFN